MKREMMRKTLQCPYCKVNVMDIRIPSYRYYGMGKMGGVIELKKCLLCERIFHTVILHHRTKKGKPH